METLKILQISTAVYPLPPEGYSGIEQVVHNLSNELVSMGHEVTVAAPIGTSKNSLYNVFETVQPSLSNDEFGAFAVYKDEMCNGYDIIHDHTHIKCAYTHPDARKLNICSTLHNQVNFQTPAHVPHMNLIGLSSQHSLHTSSVLGIPVRYVYNGIDMSNYRYEEQKSDRLLFFSRIARFKGAHEAINIAKRLSQPLDVAGEDIFVNDPPYVHSIMSSCTDNVVYMGTVPHAIKESLLCSARALLLPLLWDEPFGLVAVEALASGTPVIALNRGAMSEIIIDGVTGFLCNSIPEMIESVGKIDEIDPKACLKRAMDFTSEVMAVDYNDLYTEILEGRMW